MNQDYVLGKLSQVMDWGTDRARDEFAWLRLMTRMKYDGYQDFLAGVRFIECLISWLQQFESRHRETAYAFVRESLVYIGPLEIAHLVELFYPEVIRRSLMQVTADKLNVKRHHVWRNADAEKLYSQLLRQTLFLELSDGARIDVFRRANAGVINNEQIVTAPRIIRAKWDELLTALRKDLNDQSARFAFVYVVDDFIGSCTTLLRKNKDSKWTGKLMRLWEDLNAADVLASHLQDDWQLCVHHYVASDQATKVAAQRQTEALTERTNDKEGWFERVIFSFGMTLPEDLPIKPDSGHPFLELVNQYYDDAIETESIKVGGDDARLGFGKCGLPLILDHNTPNNSIALLWAESNGKNGKHAMRPLFRRRQRHL
jgi:hypothetical protein